uniref:Uncharacterized protein n=1 Tax=Anguilla anguilla TaxID=7936 RepID=A0A0E9TQQ3_ANGAN
MTCFLFLTDIVSHPHSIGIVSLWI